MARAEGITETVGTIELRCAEPIGLGFGSPDVLTITVELNTRITSQINDMREVQGLEYTNLTDATESDFMTPSGDGAAAAKLSEDGTTITWKVRSAEVNLGGNGNTGFQVTIGGIKANASTVGNGEDVTAVVRVGGAAAHSDSSLKLADVTTGLALKVVKADILQCETGTTGGTATVTIQEGFAAAIVDTNKFMVSFIGIPEGVTVKVPATIPALSEGGDVTAAMAMASIGLMLQTGRTSVTVKDEVGTVVLSSSGSGEVIYEVIDGTTTDTLAKEWADLAVTFSWESGNVIDSGEVAVSFAPVSTMGGDTFMDEGELPERYVESGSQTIIDVSPCETTMLFPYVTGSRVTIPESPLRILRRKAAPAPSLSSGRINPKL